MQAWQWLVSIVIFIITNFPKMEKMIHVKEIVVNSKELIFHCQLNKLSFDKI